ncbi:MAG: (2Fe-2S)-binding protein [Gemmatimonadota bacterium]|nr:(2Fe-2S)-binding protein [Gemmatimonadota bacterium]
MTGIAPVPLTRIRRRGADVKQIALTIDGHEIQVPEGTTILAATNQLGVEIPTLCFIETMRPVNVCRICVVEVKGARALVPSCSRAVEAGMEVRTNSPRVRHSRKLILEMLASSVDLSQTPKVAEWMRQYGAKPERFGPKAPPSPAGARDALVPGHHEAPNPAYAATVAQPAKLDNDLYVRDYAKCILCYKCVEACGPEHQNSFAIAVAGRGFDARISTELAVALPESACVYCGNCIAVCPTGALVPKTEFDMRAEGTWDESKQTATDTICPYCGVGCTLTLHVQDNEIVKATSPLGNDITVGNLCVKGRFGWRFVKGAAKGAEVAAGTGKTNGRP